jgi:Arc/MetJ family transcription regulator
MEKTTTIRLNQDKVAMAAQILGTKGLKSTVDAALDEIVAKRAWSELKQMMVEGVIELSSEEVRKQAWR